MGTLSLPQIATILSYVLIIALYTRKVIKVARKPYHLRWELYPVVHDPGYKHGGSYMEEFEWWTRPRSKSTFRSIIFLLKNYLFFGEYFRRKRGYWTGLYPWHIGFYLIISFHIITFFSALAMTTTGVVIAAGSASVAGRAVYYLSLVVAVGAFTLGSIGSISLLLQRALKKDLKDYAAPMNYFNYAFFLLVFLSGLVAWAFFDPSLSSYREFWQGLITLKYVAVEPPVYVHIMLFSLFLIYLPFTRSTHYITMLISFFRVRWDDAPNIMGSETENKVKQLLDKPVSWTAPHIQAGRNWGELARGLPEDGREVNK